MKADLSGVTQRRVATNGIELNIAEQGDGPLILLVHGFPESWYSWRHQFAPLVAAGYHVVAPDMRGYGKSDQPHEIEAYNTVALANDVVGLIPALGYDDAIVIGHDWGAMITWRAALDQSTKVNAMRAFSVPFMPLSPVTPLAVIKVIFKDQIPYQLDFQEPVVAEAELAADVATAFTQLLIIAYEHVRMVYRY